MKKPSIVLTKTTPYMVHDLGNFSNSKREKLTTNPVMALCRCGESQNKPCCDGSHVKKGIDSEKKKGRMRDKVRDYVGKDITIHDNRGVCSHDGGCVDSLPSVFEKGRWPWINPDAAGVEEIMAAIKKCPSGALSYTIGEETRTSIDREPAIKVAQNGPLEITGGIIFEDDMGSKPQSAEHYTLCRCGESKNKPFCDGSHNEIDFTDDKN